MKLVAKALEVNIHDGFTNDLLEREPFGESLSNLIVNSSEPLVLSIDARWGEGKTTFAKMWRGYLLERGMHSIYIDAFKSDYINDGFIAIAGAIDEYVEDNLKDEAQKIEFRNKAKKVGAGLLTWSAKVAAKAVTLGAIREAELEELSGIKDSLVEDAGSIMEELVGEQLSEYKENYNRIESFKEILSQMPAQLSANQEGVNPLVVIVDELDRCKPSYAVEVLENIKHFFSVKNVVFVLIMHREQLEKAISSIYGQGIDARTYLQKFITIETMLPKRFRDHKNDLAIYAGRLANAHELGEGDERELIINSVVLLGQNLEFTLRDLEKAFTNISVLYMTSKKNQLRLVPLIVLIGVGAVRYPGFPREVEKGEISFEIVKERFKLDSENLSSYLGNPDWVVKWIKISTLTDSEFSALEESEKKEITEYMSSLAKYGLSRNNLLTFYAKKLLNFVIQTV